MIFTVRLTIRVDPPFRLAFRVLLGLCKKTGALLVPNHCFKLSLVGQNFHIYLQSGSRQLTPPYGFFRINP